MPKRQIQISNQLDVKPTELFNYKPKDRRERQILKHELVQAEDTKIKNTVVKKLLLVSPTIENWIAQKDQIFE